MDNLMSASCWMVIEATRAPTRAASANVAPDVRAKTAPAVTLSPAPVGSSGAAAAPTLPVEPMAVADAEVDAAPPEASQVPAEPVTPASLVMKA